MATMRRSSALAPNRHLREEKRPKKGEGNRQWLSRHGDADGVLLLGGAGVADFRIRVAQSSLRHDMTPSRWSMCGILLEGGVVATVPLDVPDAGAVSATNAVRRCPLEDFDDPARFPNIAVIRFAEKHENAIRDIARIESDRSVIDLPSLIVPWLGFVWGAEGAGNPLRDGGGLPSAAFVETAFAMAGFDVTPGVSSASSCPEAIWQSAKWWAAYYEGTADEARKMSRDIESVAPTELADDPLAALPMVPTGAYLVRQRSAAVTEA